MALDLRPLTIAELLDRSFSTYKRHLWLFVGIRAVPASIAVLYAVSMQVVQFALAGPLQPGQQPTPEEVFRMAAPMVAGAFAFIVVYLTVDAFALGATTIAVGRLYKEEPVTVGSAYRDVRRHGGRLVLLLVWGMLRIGGAWFGLLVLCGIGAAMAALISPILSGIVFVLGMGAAFLVAAYLVVRYGVAVPSVVLENRKAGQALSRSVQLTEDHRGRVFLILLCAIVITYATAALLQGPFMMGAFLAGPGTRTALALSILGAALGAVGSMFTGPLMIIGLALAYYDLRIRKEALDLHMMLEALDAPRT